jgi:hypothetical protein
MSQLGQSLHGRPSGKSGNIDYASENGSKVQSINGFARRRCGLMAMPWTSFKFRNRRLESALRIRRTRVDAVKPMSPNKPRGIRRVDDRRMRDVVLWVLRSGAPWRDLPATDGPGTTCYNRFVRWMMVLSR